MNSHIFLFFLVLLSSLPVTISVASSKGQRIILWDLDEVILRRRHNNLRSIWNYPAKWPLLRSLSLPLLKDLAKVLSRDHQGFLSIELIMDIARRHRNRELEQFLFATQNDKEADPRMVDMVQELHKVGYQQCTGSNMGKVFFDELIKHPDMQFFRKYFDFSCEIQVTTEGLKKNQRKPHRAFYDAFLEKNNITDPSRVVFIDDKKKNVDVARKVGMDGIIFKNPRQLRKELENRHMLSPVSPVSEPQPSSPQSRETVVP